MVWWTSIKEFPEEEVGRPQVEKQVAEHDRSSGQGAAS
jgi:hypothetical protein